MTFSLAALDELDLTKGTLDRFAGLTGLPVETWRGDPDSFAETANRAAGANGLLVSWRTKVPAEIFQRFPQIKYVGLVASAFTDPSECNIDLAAAAERGVVVSTLGQYGDQTTAEWVLLRMLTAARGLQPWRGECIELQGKQLGIVGMGNMGREVAQRAAALGISVVYTGPRRKPQADSAGFRYVSAEELVENSDIVSVHTPKGIVALDAKVLSLLRPDALLISSSIGPTLDIPALKVWLENEHAAFACDICVAPEQQQLAKESPRGIYDPFIAGSSVEMRQRKSDQLVENLTAFLEGNPIRQVA